MRSQVAIRRPFWGNVLLVLVCSAFVFISIIRQDGSNFHRFMGIVGIIVFGFGGLYLIILGIRKPIAIISSEGVKSPFLRGNNFLPWEDVERFDVVTQRAGLARHKYIGIFSHSSKDVPALLINLSFSFVNADTVIGIMQMYHKEYKATHGYQWETTP